MSNNEFTIGLFDSGVGGLSVLRQLENIVRQYPRYPAYRFVYLGDTARCPYGDRDPQTIERFVLEITRWLKEKGSDCIVMACNTSAACAAQAARADSPLPVYDLIAATAQYVAARQFKTAVLATAGTVRSGAFSKAVALYDPKLPVTEIACPELVPLVEKGHLDTTETTEALKRYVAQLEHQQVQAVILGCTHYPFLKEALSRLLPGVELIDPAEHLAQVLIEQQVPVGTQPSVHREFFVTGSPESFAATAGLCLGQPLGTVKNVSVEELESLAALSPVSPAVSSAVAEAVGSSSLVP